VEVEKDCQDKNVSDDSFEMEQINEENNKTSLNDKMILEDDFYNRSIGFRSDDIENFEREELNDSLNDSTSSEESILRITQNLKTKQSIHNKTPVFKKIGFQIFEYEEI